MKLRRNPDLIFRKIAGEPLLIPTGTLAQRFNGMITLNEVAGFLWEHLEEVSSREEMVQRLLEEFEVDDQTAVRDVNGFLDMLLEKKFAVDEEI